MLTGGRVNVIAELHKDKSCTLREGTFEVMNGGCLAFSWKGAWRLTLRVAVKEERMHYMTMAVRLFSPTPLYDTYRDKRDAGLTLLSLIFSASAAKRWPWGNQLCSSSDDHERHCTAVCKRHLFSCENEYSSSTASKRCIFRRRTYCVVLHSISLQKKQKEQGLGSVSPRGSQAEIYVLFSSNLRIFGSKECHESDLQHLLASEIKSAGVKDVEIIRNSCWREWELNSHSLNRVQP